MENEKITTCKKDFLIFLIDRVYLISNKIQMENEKITTCKKDFLIFLIDRV